MKKQQEAARGCKARRLANLAVLCTLTAVSGPAYAQKASGGPYELSIFIDNGGEPSSGPKGMEASSSAGQTADQEYAGGGDDILAGIFNVLDMSRPADQFFLESLQGPAVLLGDSSLSGSSTLTGELTVDGLFAAQGQVGYAGACVIANSFSLPKSQSLPACWTPNTLPPEGSPLNMAAERAFAAANNGDAAIARYIDAEGVLRLDGGTNLVLSSGSYLLKGLSVGGRAQLSVDGPVELYVEGPVTFSGQAQVNNAGIDTWNLAILVAPLGAKPSSVNVSGQARVGAFIYAPSSEMNVSGQAAFAGPMLLRSLQFSGGSFSYTSGHALAPVPAAPNGTKSGKGASAASASPAAASEAFQLGEVFVFPNPARGAQQPYFHVETGLADEVDIRVYDVSGQQVKTATLGTANLQAIGSKLAYEALVDTSGLASGVYVVAFTSKKAGQADLKALAKFALIR